MAQLTIYLDDDTINKIEKAAEDCHSSVSKWVRENLKKVLENDWPDSYFNIFGSLDDTDLSEPEEIDPGNDIKRDNFEVPS
ncbi:MAG: ribbon-helix-helix protein, CopG family [Spirochaetales bacterium]|nr:ribbon-helix-helix protein, CopG family [Spirochaetales bacterium]